MIGQTFGRLRVVGEGPLLGRNRAWSCVCECGTSRVVRGDRLRSGETRSCGCLRPARPKNATGKRRPWSGDRQIAYVCWTGMRRRCYDPRNRYWPDYGGRGIAICQAWLESFDAFFADMGPRPSPDHSIDRIDNDGNYEPGNCRWATRAEQARNTRRTNMLTAFGVTMCLTDWATARSVSSSTLSRRIAEGWDAERALTTPPLPPNAPKPPRKAAVAACAVVALLACASPAAVAEHPQSRVSSVEPGTRLSSTRLQTSEPERPVAARAAVKALRQPSTDSISPAAMVPSVRPASAGVLMSLRSVDAGSHLEAQTILVRMALAEARWSEPDHAAMWHVLARWSRRLGMSLEDAIDLRVGRFSRRPAKWITRVQPTCEEPIGWPRRLSWLAHRDRCVELFADAERFLAGDLRDPCPRAEGWRQRGDALRQALANGRVLVRCGATANGFVRAPRRGGRA